MLGTVHCSVTVCNLLILFFLLKLNHHHFYHELKFFFETFEMSPTTSFFSIGVKSITISERWEFQLWLQPLLLHLQRHRNSTGSTTLNGKRGIAIYLSWFPPASVTNLYSSQIEHMRFLWVGVAKSSIESGVFFSVPGCNCADICLLVHVQCTIYFRSASRLEDLSGASTWQHVFSLHPRSCVGVCIHPSPKNTSCRIFLGKKIK